MPPVTPPGSEPGSPTDDTPGSLGVGAETQGGVEGTAQDDTYVARVARGAGISTAGQGAGRVLGYATQSALARGLGRESFGLYTLGVAVVTAAQIISQFGLDNGVVRYVAHYRAQGDTARVRGTILQAVGLTFAFSLVVAVAIFFGAGTIAGFFDPDLEPVVRAFAFAVPFFALMSIICWATQGFQTVAYATYTQQILRPLIYLLLVIGVYFVGASLVGIVAAYVISMALGVLIGLFFLRRLFPPLLNFRTRPKFETRALFGVSVPMSVSRATQYANNWTAILVLGIFQPAGVVGLFQAAFRTATFATLVRFAFNGIFSPIISNLHAQENTEDLGRLYKDVTRWTFTGAFAIFLLIVLLTSEILTVFGGKEYAAGATALIIVAFAQLFSTSVGPANRMLAMTDNQTVLMIITTIGALTGVAVCFALIPDFGMIGAAIGAAAAILTENTATLIFVRRRLGFWPYNLVFWKPLAAGLLAATLAYAVKVLLALPGLLLTVGAVAAAFGISFLALLLLFGLNDTDREFLGAFRDVALRSLRRVRRSRGESRG
ncbi:Heteropolysaccharide repeat unit export protein [uncultured Rubrobacteraceae bacterium]|uniref:Heteropolysaccharide repeat unit export protein n=1 Tax=uncultured Rubrobacteraceae bacterium TaxID=349277 RepID=A0A6J4QPN6_9ACTN|nr:Heteropolysaccharide repeat unit export protein [uncultured Rubrobacteraceae bacterium]